MLARRHDQSLSFLLAGAPQINLASAGSLARPILTQARLSNGGILLVIFQAFQQSVLEHVAQREDALEPAFRVDDDEAVDAGAADCVVDGGHVVLDCAGEDAREVLWCVSVSVVRYEWDGGSVHLIA